MTHPNSFGSRSKLEAGGRSYTIYRLDSLNSLSSGKAASLPFSLKILLENLLRNEDGKFVKKDATERQSLGRPPADLAEVLALFALAGPAISAV